MNKDYTRYSDSCIYFQKKDLKSFLNLVTEEEDTIITEDNNKNIDHLNHIKTTSETIEKLNPKNKNKEKKQPYPPSSSLKLDLNHSIQIESNLPLTTSLLPLQNSIQRSISEPKPDKYQIQKKYKQELPSLPLSSSPSSPHEQKQQQFIKKDGEKPSLKLQSDSLIYHFNHKNPLYDLNSKALPELPIQNLMTTSSINSTNTNNTKSISETESETELGSESDQQQQQQQQQHHHHFSSKSKFKSFFKSYEFIK